MTKPVPTSPSTIGNSTDPDLGRRLEHSHNGVAHSLPSVSQSLVELYRETPPVLAPDGTQVGPFPAGLTPADGVTLYRWLLLGRVFDEKAVHLQRQGRMGTYPPLVGQEAAQAGSAYALHPEDWLIPSYRDHLAARMRGLSFRYTLMYWMGIEEGNRIPDDVQVFTTAVSIGDQLPHATGAALATQLLHEKRAFIVYFGDGATSEGDFHESLNFAGVYRLPLVYFCQNNQYAISTPRTRQTASATIAQKAIAYGFPGERVDGNDVFAVYDAVHRALERARAGEGPTLVEAVTYRLGPHTTADDPSRYRSKDEEEIWAKQRDPLLRLRRFLQSQNLWTDEDEERARAEAVAEVQQEIAAAEAAVQEAKRHPEQIFDHTFAKLPLYLQRQRQEFLTVTRGDNGQS
ncbi:MAG: pyruvate dehydrogenase (acetyl-transferring) E1 component subunit alpha [Limnochordaceae bacterium]|nr:pyruvate dehydrogenase (acetyl-transferring) E1 component subunit alpha [Limnochordaceae bacterium]